QPEENYFVVINVPESQSHQMTIDKSGMVWGNESTSAPPMELHQLHRYDNTQVDTSEISEITFNYLENYNQELSDIVSESENLKELHTDQQTAEASFDVLDTVTFNKDNYDTGDTLYYMLKAVLKKTENGATTTKYFPSEASASIAMYAYYKVGDTKHYLTVVRDESGRLKLKRPLVDTVETPAVEYQWQCGNEGEAILPFAVKSESGYEYVDLAGLRNAAAAAGVSQFYIEIKTKADGPLSFSMHSVVNNDLVPVREEEGSTNKSMLYFTSSLSFEAKSLSYSNLKETADGKTGFYLKNKGQAVLSLSALNIDQLGINPSDPEIAEEETADIDTMLILDLSEMKGFNQDISNFDFLKNTAGLRFEITLNQKGRGTGTAAVTDYSQVSGDGEISKYIKEAVLTDAASGAAISVGKSSEGTANDRFILTITKDSSGTFPYYQTGSGQFIIPITFKVYAEPDGHGIDLSAVRYSNFRLFASVSAVPESEGAAGSTELSVDQSDAFITYTYARINTDGIWASETVSGVTP
ncbi:MAG: hypothetical protein PUC98_03715, partial [Clostridiales bacterium]|nr:hypothetical protein [Clostridiales bacterium]